MASFNLFHVLLVFVSIFVHCSSSPIIQAAIDKDTHAYYNCTRNSTSEATHSVYNSNIKTLLNRLSSNSTNNARYYNTTVTGQNTEDTVYGIFHCKRSISPERCQVCVKKAAKLILSLCNISKEAIIWYNVCFVRYSDRRFFSTIEERPEISFMNDKDYVGQVGHYSIVVWDMLNDLRTEAANGSTKYAEKSVNITDDEKLYGVAWCIQYLSSENCSLCISDAIADVQTSCCRGKAGGTILYPSCGVRFELYPFLTARPPPPPLPMSPRTSAQRKMEMTQGIDIHAGKRKRKMLTIIVIVVAIVVSLVLLALGCSHFLGLNVRRSSKELPVEFFISMKIPASK